MRLTRESPQVCACVKGRETPIGVAQHRMHHKQMIFAGFKSPASFSPLNPRAAPRHLTCFAIQQSVATACGFVDGNHQSAWLNRSTKVRVHDRPTRTAEFGPTGRLEGRIGCWSFGDLTPNARLCVNVSLYVRSLAFRLMALFCHRLQSLSASHLHPIFMSFFLADGIGTKKTKSAGPSQIFQQTFIF
jgi:hypothetical protein